VVQEPTAGVEGGDGQRIEFDREIDFLERIIETALQFQIHRIPVVRQRVIRVERKRAFELQLPFNETPLAKIHGTERRKGLDQGGIKLQRP